ncbi:MAG TPA: sigma-70 family RNA polymerase sigma factor [Candidatus Acidoferrales bacterium]|nr:sigma-70 family RNA polymerase sigma factor [Candidatus Acidoferrales bacterium]
MVQIKAPNVQTMSPLFSGRKQAASDSDAIRDLRSDEELMLEVQRGDGDAFAVLFDRYNRLVLTIALRILHDAAEAQEVTQIIFFEFYRSARRFDPARGTLKVWLLQFAYHRSINRRNYLLLRQFYNRPDLEEATLWEASQHATPRMSVQELKRLVEQALGTLKESQRHTIEKVIFEGLTLREIAERSGESYSAVRNHYYRGLNQLRACLAEQPVRISDHRVLGIEEVSGGEA